MVIRILLFLSVWLTTMSCARDSSNASVHFDLSFLEVKVLEVFSIPSQIAIVISSDKDSLSLQLDKDLILNVKSEQGHNYIYLKPGEHLKMGPAESARLGFKVLGEHSEENKYLAEFQKIKHEQMEEFVVNIESFAQLSAKEYSNEIDLINKELIELVANIQVDTSVSDYFKSAMQHRLTAVVTNDLSYYGGFYLNAKNEYPAIPDDYYKLFLSTNIMDEAYLIFHEGRETIKFYPSKDPLFRDFDSSSDYFKFLLNKADSVYGSSLTGEYFAYDQVYSMINYLSIDEVMPFVTAFKSSTKNKYLIERLDKKINPWLELASGKQAPDFKARTADKKEVSLSDLKGKKVYIDIWATWCGPCLAEIPYLKEIEKEMADKNIEFVSVSIDEGRDRGNWEEYIQRNELTGLQLFANGAWKSDVVEGYNITSIPRFLLIDEEGLIINSTAPRPSSGELEELLLK